MTVAKEALAQNPDSKVQTLQALESEKRIRLLSGGPPLSGPTDVDKIGVLPWQVVLYVAGDAPNAALEFISFILEYKLQKGTLTTMPRLPLHCPNGALQGSLPAPWTDACVSDASIQLPKPFATYPPRGRRHVLCQLERKGDDEDGPYIFSIFGNIYPFRNRFDEHQVAGAQLDLEEGDETTARSQEYVRYVEFDDLEEGKESMTTIFEKCLMGLPLYFINMTSQEDEVASWLLDRSDVVLGDLVKVNAAGTPEH